MWEVANGKISVLLFASWCVWITTTVPVLCLNNMVTLLTDHVKRRLNACILGWLRASTSIVGGTRSPIES